MKKNHLNSIAVLEKIKSPLKIINQIQIPKLLKNQLLIKISYTSVCGSQIFEIDGQRESKKYIPHAMGHEATGIVINKGINIKKFRKGDKVFISWIKSKGSDSKNLDIFYPDSKKKINYGKVATFLKFAVVPENRVNKIPKKINLKDGVLLGCAIPSGAGMIINQVKIKKNDKILILGLGGVGISSLMATKLFSNIDVYGYDLNKKIVKKIKLLFNNCHFLDKKSFFALKNKIIKSKISGFDYVFDTTGSAKSIGDAISFLKNSGKLVFASHPKENDMIKIDPFELIKGKKIEGSWGGSTKFGENLKTFEKIIIKNRRVINKITENLYSFKEINKAIYDMRKKKTIRPVIKLD